ncbi:MAG: hypothetical protein LBU17_01000 [Treponema sp.]|jgi:hypothetical protein|nr:hypothetical protein [Treponema sp.]
MTKVVDDDRQQYAEKIKTYQEVIESIVHWEQEFLNTIQAEPADATLKRLNLVEQMLNLTSYYLIINEVSYSMLQFANKNALEDGRKSLSKGITYLQDMVTNYVDQPFSEYEDKVAPLEPVNPAERYRLIRKMGLTIQLLENAYGDNTKWKWFFVDLEGRFSAVTKNIFDMKNMIVNMDPRSPYYEPAVYHMRLIKKLLQKSADRFREKYELATKARQDFQMGINFLNALRRIHILLGDSYEAEQLKKKVDVWSAKMETDIKNRTEA